MNICNKYETQKLIGNGAQGSVFLAIDNRLGRRVAIKSLHKEFVSDETQFKRFEEEAKILAKLNHESIVTLYDFCYDDEGFYLVMELVKGKPLDKHIKDKDCTHQSPSCPCTGPIAEIRAINIVIKILNGINYIHDLKIVHRDIKPSNIIIDSNDNIKLLDFGIANNTKKNLKLTKVNTNAGFTPMYATPEHMSKSKITKQSDIYSLGVTLWHMLTGVPPYEGLSEYQIYGKIERDRLPNIQDVYKHVSIRMNEIVQKATSKLPSDRYDSCKGFIRDLEDLKEKLLQKNNTISIDTFSDDPLNTLHKNVEVKVRNVENSSIIINNKGVVGSELTYSNIPGKTVKITISKEGYRKYVKQFVLNDDKNLKVFLVKKNKPVLFVTLSVLVVVLSILLIIKIIL
jgi:serine/threonine protein kinase